MTIESPAMSHRPLAAFNGRPVHAVVFDMDGLLLNTEVLARRGLQRAAADFGLDMPTSLCEQMIGVPLDGCRRLMLARFGPKMPVDAFFAEATRHLHAQIDAGQLTLKPGAAQLLARLDQEGLPRALATSSSHAKALHHLAAADIGHGFEAIVTRNDVARGKPHPDIYLEAARRLGQPPGACLALEDSHNGVRAAHAAAMPVVMVPDLLPPTEEMRRLSAAVLHDLHAVCAALFNLPARL
jgi:HAD superfamily hydrolase (TIGR01509 family)